MKIFTIGFTKKSARDFFTKLRDSGARRLVDVRLNNVSQLAGFAKRDDLEFFLREICRMDYIHLPALAPKREMLDRYREDALHALGEMEQTFAELESSDVFQAFTATEKERYHDAVGRLRDLVHELEQDNAKEQLAS